MYFLARSIKAFLSFLVVHVLSITKDFFDIKQSSATFKHFNRVFNISLKNLITKQEARENTLFTLSQSFKQFYQNDGYNCVTIKQSIIVNLNVYYVAGLQQNRITTLYILYIEKVVEFRISLFPSSNRGPSFFRSFRTKLMIDKRSFYHINNSLGVLNVIPMLKANFLKKFLNKVHAKVNLN